jgi:hypothetical protein
VSDIRGHFLRSSSMLAAEWRYACEDPIIVYLGPPQEGNLSWEVFGSSRHKLS